MDFWQELIKIIGNTLEEHDDFGSFVPYPTGEESNFPYTTIPETTAESWMTLGNVTAGEEIPLRFHSYVDSHSGGPRRVREVNSAIQSKLHLKQLDAESIFTVALKKQNESKPIKIEEDPDIWFQYIEFWCRLKYKKDSDYYN